MDGMRLNKYLAACGVCSRRDADRLVAEGKVTVNGQAAVPGMKVTDKDEVWVRGRKLAGQDRKVVLAYYKPVGVVCTHRDVHAERTVADEIDYPIRVTYAGRLDKDSEGLLLLTNDGALIETMMRSANGHEKEYIVRISGQLSEEAVENMRGGVYLDELDVMSRPCRIEILAADLMRIVLTQGLNRQIRRMCKTQGYEVTALKRTRVIDIGLGDLKPGEYRELTQDEIQSLYEKCGLKKE